MSSIFTLLSDFQVESITKVYHITSSGKSKTKTTSGRITNKEPTVRIFLKRFDCCLTIFPGYLTKNSHSAAFTIFSLQLIHNVFDIIHVVSPYDNLTVSFIYDVH